jgi:hypothetical protein
MRTAEITSATMSKDEAAAILAKPSTIYSMVVGSKPGTIVLNRMTDVGTGKGTMGRWKLEPVKTVPSRERRDLEAEMAILNQEIGDQRSAARQVLGIELV